MATDGSSATSKSGPDQACSCFLLLFPLMRFHLVLRVLYPERLRFPQCTLGPSFCCHLYAEKAARLGSCRGEWREERREGTHWRPRGCDLRLWVDSACKVNPHGPLTPDSQPSQSLSPSPFVRWGLPPPWKREPHEDRALGSVTCTDQ